ncbi:hypothetical protein [Paracoccus hibiscisoli]|uniref:hypothetical protein n=1 Tax=Paracoccus hibiscisoli TaxID=2023261 RepID=UPI0023F1F208|nr:hypothetical protein [Paracoccus hibiscisoli]
MTGGAVGAASLIAAAPCWKNPVAAPKTAKITQVRNTKTFVETGGVKFLGGSLLADQGNLPGFTASASSHLSNPMDPMPIPQDSLASGDAVIVTPRTCTWITGMMPQKAAVARDKPLSAQSEHKAELIRADGVTDVHVLTEATESNGVQLIKTV